MNIIKITGKKSNLEDDILTYNYLLEGFKKYPNDFKKLNLLYDGKNGEMNLKERLEKIGQKVTQDKLANIILKNRHTTRRCIFYPNEISNSLFFISSFINHSCDNNIFYEGFGDYIFCFAIKDIPNGEAITISYIDPKQKYITRKEELLSNWRIKCQCNLCKYDSKTLNEEYKINFYRYSDFFMNYIYKANISKEDLIFVTGKIKEIQDFIVTYQNKLTSYEKCQCLIYIFKYYNFISDVASSKAVKEQFFVYENFNNFNIAIDLFNENLRFYKHLIDVKYKDCDKLNNELINELIKYYKKITPYQEDSIKEMIDINIKQYYIDLQ